MINLVIFTKNRAFQLEALLRSIEQNCNIFKDCFIIIKHTNEEFKEGYKFLTDKHHIVNDNSFQKSLLSVMDQEAFNQNKYTCFMVDDMICYRDINKEYSDYLEYLEGSLQAVCHSLRLGKNYKNAPLLMMGVQFNNDARYYHFPWKKQTKNFAYPFSVDGHIFKTNYIKSLIGQILTFSNPNKLEIGLQQFKTSAPEYMSCFGNSICVSIPINKVSDTSSCSAGEKFSYSAEYLNKIFLEGKRMDFKNMDFSQVNDCHQEIELKIV